MKVSIHRISLCLFWWFQTYLDLDTGETYNTYLHAAEIERLKNKKRIPRYSEGPLYQHYLEVARERLGIELGDWFDQYPKFEMIPDQNPEGMIGFIGEAHAAVDSFDDPIFPSYNDYYEEFSLQLAKAWCESEGIEWYDDWPDGRESYIPGFLMNTLEVCIPCEPQPKMIRLSASFPP